MNRTLVTAWAWLIALSGGSTIVAYSIGHGFNRHLAGAAILALALLKARLVLWRYLGLAQARGWLTGFVSVIGLTCLLIFGLYLIPSFL